MMHMPKEIFLCNSHYVLLKMIAIKNRKEYAI